MSKKVSEVSVQTLYSISSNILSMIENAKPAQSCDYQDEIQQPLNQISETPYPKDYRVSAHNEHLYFKIY